MVYNSPQSLKKRNKLCTKLLFLHPRDRVTNTVVLDKTLPSSF